jgi:hypothetical protein
MDDEAAVNAGENNMRHSHATHDLFNHIGAGKEAVWVLPLPIAFNIELLRAIVVVGGRSIPGGFHLASLSGG